VARRILERERELAELAAVVRESAGGHGYVVLVSGEAGICKSSLVDAARSLLPADGRILVGHCDDLATARVLGPFRDLIGSVGTDVTRPCATARIGIASSRRCVPSWTGPATRPCS
jgi:predicted ATPase